jgi:predicted metal-dependent hydrolase
MAMNGLLRLFERGPEPAHLDLKHNGEVYRIAINRSTRSRRFTLRVRAASRDVLLTMPARASMAAAREFAERHSAWIRVQSSSPPNLDVPRRSRAYRSCMSRIWRELRWNRPQGPES